MTKRGYTNRFLALVTTNINLAPEKIAQMYGCRWKIGWLFKGAKHYLRLVRS